MFRTSLTAVATGVLALGLVVGGPTTAQAKVKPKDLPSKAQFAKAFPELKGATFTTQKSKKVGFPTKKCGKAKLKKVKSGIVRSGVPSTFLPQAVAGVVEFKSKTQAKKYFKASTKFVKKCTKYKSAGVTIKMKKTKAPKVGQQRLAVVQRLSSSGYTHHGAVVMMRHGKRVAEVSAVDDSKIAKKKINKLAKVAAKKMR